MMFSQESTIQQMRQSKYHHSRQTILTRMLSSSGIQAPWKRYATSTICVVSEPVLQSLLEPIPDPTGGLLAPLLTEFTKMQQVLYHYHDFSCTEPILRSCPLSHVFPINFVWRFRFIVERSARCIFDILTCRGGCGCCLHRH
jgi:hypothetical protein